MKRVFLKLSVFLLYSIIQLTNENPKTLTFEKI